MHTIFTVGRYGRFVPSHSFLPFICSVRSRAISAINPNSMGSKTIHLFVSASFCFGLMAGCTDSSETNSDVKESVVDDTDTGESRSPSLPAELAGTEWQLVEFQSRDDTSSQPQGHSTYTLVFHENGRVGLQLDCTQRTGAWSAQRSVGIDSDAAALSGSIALSPLAATRVSCPSPSTDQKIARDMESVRTYHFRDGFSSLRLSTDGGLYVWEPLETASDPFPGVNQIGVIS